MTKRAIWFAIILLAFAPAAFADAVSGISGPFGIDNTVGDTRAKWIFATARNPYTENAHQLRGQIHAHSRHDGGVPGETLSDEVFAFRYTNLGYDFLAETNHNTISASSLFSPPWSGWVPTSTEITHGSIAVINGHLKSLRDGHLISIDMANGTTMDMIDYDSGSGMEPRDVVKNMSERIRRVQTHGGLAFIAHPDASPYNETVDELVRICRIVKPSGIAIYNHACPNAESTWDQVLNRYNQPVWGYAEDDYHPDTLSSRYLGVSWIGVPGNPGTGWTDIRPEIVNGDFYSYWLSSGFYWVGSFPTMHVTVGASGGYPTIHAQINDLNGKTATIHFTNGNEWFNGPDYTCDGHEKYIRVQADVSCSLGCTLYIRSQPIWIDSQVWAPQYSPPPGGKSMSGTSSLHVSYLISSDIPPAPERGYLGNPCGVTSDDGTVPPGASVQLSYEDADLGPLGGTDYLAIYRYDDASSAWLKVGGTVDPGTQTIESPITALGKYCISADLPADTTAPEVFIDNPVYGGVVSTDTTLKATVNDDLGAWRVRFYLNDHLVGEDTSGLDGWSADIKIADYCAGNWTLKAVAEDLAGNEGSVEVPIYIASSTPLPTVTITSPASGATLSGTVTASGTCGDDVAVAAVTLKLDDTVVGFGDVSGGNWTCQVDTSYLVDGSRTLTATVEDYPGNIASASVPVTINSGAPSYAPGKAKTLDDGASVRVGNAIVVAVPALTGDGYYVESTDRGSGIRARTSKTLSIGDKIGLIGTVNASGTEKAVEAFDVGVVSSGNTLPRPLGTSPRWLFKTPDSLGKIVKMWGTLGAIDSSSPAKWFILKDPSGIDVKCVLGDGVTINPAWTMIYVVGVVSGGQASPTLLVSQSSDIKNLLGP